MLNVDFNSTLFPQSKQKIYAHLSLCEVRPHQLKYALWELCQPLQFILSSLVLELGGLGYFTKYPSPPSSGTNLHLEKIEEDNSLKLITIIVFVFQYFQDNSL